MTTFVLGALLPSCFVSLLLGFVVRRLAPRWGLIDKPNAARKVHTVPTPLGGGLAIWLSVLSVFAAGTFALAALTGMGTGEPWPALANLPVPEFARPHLAGAWQQLPDLWGLLAAGSVLVLLGLADDRWGLPWQVRLGVQFAVALTVVLCDFRATFFIDSYPLTVLVSVLWIVGLVNSFNMLDNMDGLSSGVAAIAASILASVLLVAHDPLTGQPQLFVAGFLLVLVGAILGFLWHNRPRAKLFMGDAGSYLLGFCLAMMTILATFSGEGVPPHASLAPICVMAVPLYDMTTVLWIRIREGRSPFVADKNHFSHRLVELGMSKGQAVLTVYLTTATCGLGALLLHEVTPFGALVVLALVGCVLLLIAILEATTRRERRRRSQAAEEQG